MTEPARISCCIVGSGRSYKADGQIGEIICGKHFKAVRCERPDLARLDREARRLFRYLMRRYHKHPTARLDKMTDTACDRHNRRWEAVRREAQRLQDVGFFAPRPRRRKADVREDRTTGAARDRFEDQFQRLKRGYQEAGQL